MSIKNAPEYYEWKEGENSRLFGVVAAQNRTAWLAMSLLLDNIKPKTIVELGGGVGGLTVMLQIWCLVYGSSLHTYDKDAEGFEDLFRRLGIDKTRGDIFQNEQKIRSELQGEGVSLLLCDNGDKVVEMKRFTDSLKPGDYVAMHDYAETPDFYHAEIRDKYWGWHESQLSHVSLEFFEPAYQDLMKYAVWGVFKKR